MRPNVEIADQEREKGLEANLSRRDVSTLEFGDEAAGSGRDVQVRGVGFLPLGMPMKREDFVRVASLQLIAVAHSHRTPNADRRGELHLLFQLDEEMSPSLRPNPDSRGDAC